MQHLARPFQVSHLDAIPILTTPSYSSTSSESKSTSLHEASSATSRQASPDRGVVSSKNVLEYFISRLSC